MANIHNRYAARNSAMRELATLAEDIMARVGKDRKALVAAVQDRKPDFNDADVYRLLNGSHTLRPDKLNAAIAVLVAWNETLPDDKKMGAKTIGTLNDCAVQAGIRFVQNTAKFSLGECTVLAAAAKAIMAAEGKSDQDLLTAAKSNNPTLSYKDIVDMLKGTASNPEKVAAVVAVLTAWNDGVISSRRALSADAMETYNKNAARLKVVTDSPCFATTAARGR